MGSTLLIEDLPRALDRLVRSAVAADERIVVALKGGASEALVCTDQRVVIAKTGWPTGQLFGSRIFQAPYSAITSADVQFGYPRGFIAITVGGLAAGQPSGSSLNPMRHPALAPNCVSIKKRGRLAVFTSAANLILARAHETHAA